MTLCHVSSMIISKQKSFQHILSRVKGYSVYIFGCSECATMCRTGGEHEVKKLADQLAHEGVIVTGWKILEPACNHMNLKRLLPTLLQDMNQADCILVMACGDGVQVVSSLFPSHRIISGNDTLFLGVKEKINQYTRKCNLCGDCVVDQFYALCPIARCPKHLLNGPCGGSEQGICEVESNLPCVWEQIYVQFKERGGENPFIKYQPPHDWSQSERILYEAKK